MPFTLINAGPSPFGRKIIIAMVEKGLDYEIRYDMPWGDQTCTGEYSPVQQLPILITEQGENVYDSTYILEWLEGRYPKPALLPADVDGRLDAKKRQMLGERLMEFAQALIFELNRPEPSKPWLERQTKKVLGAFQELDRLYANRRLVDGAPIDLGDIAIGTTALLLEFAVDSGMCKPIDAIVWRGRYPALTPCIEVLERRPSFLVSQPRKMDVDLQKNVA